MKIFITGNKGQLGHDATEVLATSHDVKGMDLPDLDITNAQSIEQGLGRWPDIVLNCAAYTNVDGCESDFESAWAVNAEGVRLLAEYARTHSAYLVHISTDYVFDGRRPVPQPYCETDPTAPVSAYGRSKLAGEEAIRSSGCAHAIVRTSWLYGIHGSNFLMTMLRLALGKPQTAIKVVNDQYGCPTWSYPLARQLQRIMDTRTTGILHASGAGSCTWYALACHFLEAMRVPHNLVPCTTSEYPTPALRPMNSILRNSRLLSAGIYSMQHWQADVDEFAATYHDTLIREAEERIRGAS